MGMERTAALIASLERRPNPLAFGAQSASRELVRFHSLTLSATPVLQALWRLNYTVRGELSEIRLRVHLACNF